MTTTSWTTLLVAAVFGALGGWLIVVVSGALDLVPPYVPWTAPAALAVIAALVGALAWSTYQRIHVRRERVASDRAVAFLVLGKASALAGALVAGGYLTFALMFVGRWEADAPRSGSSAHWWRWWPRSVSAWRGCCSSEPARCLRATMTTTSTGPTVSTDPAER